MLAAAALTSCQEDNMEAPACHVSGRMVYNGQPLGVKGTNGAMNIELWQAGFGKESAQNMHLDQSGRFSTYVYEGKCRIITKKGVGPWQDSDTLRVDVRGNVELDYEVIPYFFIENLSYEVDGNIVTADFDVRQIVDDAVLGNVGMVLGSGTFVDTQINLANIVGVPDAAGHVCISCDLEPYADKVALFARVYVSTRNVAEALYSPESYRIR